MTTQDLVKAQKDESWTKRLFEIKKKGIKIDKADIQTEKREVRVMLKNMEKLEIDENDLLIESSCYS